MNTLTEAQPKAASALKRDRILFVLTPKERALFLPEADLDRFSDHARVEINPEGIDAGGWLRLLHEHRPTVLVSAWNTPPLPAAWLEAPDCPLRYVCHLTGSVRGLVPRSALVRGVRVTNWGTSISHTIAEHAVLLVLALLRNTLAWPAAAASRQYSADLMPVLRTRSLRGKRVGLHGFGAIAREITRLLKPFQVDLAACSHGVPPALFEEYGVTRCASLEALFERSDVLIECESLTAQSRGSVTEDLLRRLPPDAVFVNVGRGQIVDESALARLAAEKRLRVGLDVLHEQLLGPESPVATTPGILFSPHVAGPTWDTYHLCGDHALANLRRYLNDEPLSGLLTPELYDRAT